jgi:hypothetical protein
MPAGMAQTQVIGFDPDNPETFETFEQYRVWRDRQRSSDDEEEDIRL